MMSDEFTPEHNSAPAAPSLKRSLLSGGLGFCLASLCVFATVAFAERWMYRNLGVMGSYVAWTTLFIMLGGVCLSPLVIGPARVLRTYAVFSASFLLYAAVWVGSYFTWRGSVGEWVGSLAGSVMMGLLIAASFKVLRRALWISAALFIANSAGYFLGSALNDLMGGKAGMLLWGFVYGLSFGMGLGAALYLAQARGAGDSPLKGDNRASDE